MRIIENKSLDELRDRQPFRVPERYFEDFTADLMHRIPPKMTAETKVISFYDRIKPWLYLAAMFIGIIVLFNIFSKTSDSDKDVNKGLSSVSVVLEEAEDADFLEYIEELYGDKYAMTYFFDYYLPD